MTRTPRKKDAARLKELPAPEKLARMIASGNYRLALRRRFMRAPLVILEKRVLTYPGGFIGLDLRNVPTKTRWVPATVTHSEYAKVEDLPIAA